MVPPPNAEPHGMTPDGKQLYKEVRMMATSVPDTDEDGNQKYKKHPLTGDPTYPINKAVVAPVTMIYYLKAQGNGNVKRVMWRPPTPEQEREALRAQQIHDVTAGLGEALVNAGVSAQDVADFIADRTGKPLPEPTAAVTPEVKGTTSEPVGLEGNAADGSVDRFDELKVENEGRVEEAPPELAEKEYPLHTGGPHWILSDGQKFRGKREDAEKAETAIKEARAEAKKNTEASPEY